MWPQVPVVRGGAGARGARSGAGRAGGRAPAARRRPARARGAAAGRAAVPAVRRARGRGVREQPAGGAGARDWEGLELGAGVVVALRRTYIMERQESVRLHASTHARTTLPPRAQVDEAAPIVAAMAGHAAAASVAAAGTAASRRLPAGGRPQSPSPSLRGARPQSPGAQRERPASAGRGVPSGPRPEHHPHHSLGPAESIDSLLASGLLDAHGAAGAAAAHAEGQGRDGRWRPQSAREASPAAVGSCGCSCALLAWPLPRSLHRPLAPHPSSPTSPALRRNAGAGPPQRRARCGL
jgi:hypothetical protein